MEIKSQNTSEQSATIEQWVKITEAMGNEQWQIPYTFFVKGHSMFPLIRSGKDAVTVSRCDTRELRRGDIVLFRAKANGLDHVLHRIYKISGEHIQTLGDGNLAPDPWITKDQICGKVTMIRRGKLLIDPNRGGWRLLAGIWMKCWRHRRIPLKLLHGAGIIKKMLQK